MTQDDQRIYSSDDNGDLFVWNKQQILEGGNKEDLILKRFQYGEERGAIDCILIRGEAKEIFL